MLHKYSITVGILHWQILIVSNNWFEETYFFVVSQQMLAQTSTNCGFPATLF